MSGNVKLCSNCLLHLHLLRRGSIKTFRRNPCQVHGELAAQLGKLTPERVESLKILARVRLVFDDVKDVASLILGLSYCWILTLSLSVLCVSCLCVNMRRQLCVGRRMIMECTTK